jgi:hypothetical protein
MIQRSCGRCTDENQGYPTFCIPQWRIPNGGSAISCDRCARLKIECSTDDRRLGVVNRPTIEEKDVVERRKAETMAWIRRSRSTKKGPPISDDEAAFGRIEQVHFEDVNMLHSQLENPAHTYYSLSRWADLILDAQRREDAERERLNEIFRARQKLLQSVSAKMRRRIKHLQVQSNEEAINRDGAAEEEAAAAVKKEER